MRPDEAFAAPAPGLLARKGAARPALRPPRLARTGPLRPPLDEPGPPVAPSRAANRRAALTLRLDPDRHLRLRLACAVEHRSAQQIITAALDALLASMPDIERLAGRTSVAATDHRGEAP